MTDLQQRYGGESSERVSEEELALARRRLRERLRRQARRRRQAAALLAVVLAAVVGHAAVEGLAARAELLAARAELSRGVGALQAGNLDDALMRLAAAQAHTDEARARLAGPSVRAVAAVPYLGRTVRTADAVAAAAGLAAEAGAELAAATLALPDGVGALAPREGYVPVGALARVAPALAAAHDRVAEAAAVLAASHEAGVLGPVRAARADLAAQLDAVEPALDTAAAMAGALPTFLGSDGPRRYFFAAQNPAELRGTGGFVGAYAILTADGGQLDFSPFRSIIDLSATVVPGVESPDADYHLRYARYGGAGYGQNANMTPDVPTAGVAYMRLYEAVTGEPLDGAIFADPHALAALLGVVGDVEVADLGPVGADTVVDQVANEAYAALPHSHARKELLGRVAAATVGRFLAEAADRPAPAAEALIGAAGAGHLRLYSADPDVQAVFDEAGVAGRFGALAGDFLAVVGNNAGANKVDYYTDRAVTYRVWLDPDGSARAEAAVTLDNAAPTSGQVLDVIGPNVGYLDAGDNRTLLSVYCAVACEHEATAGSTDPRRGGPARERELAHPVVTTIERVPAGQQATVTHRFRIAEAWSVEDGRYHLTFHNQPTIRPSRLEVEVHAPDGWLVRRASDGVAVSPERARWSGEPGQREVFEVALGTPQPPAWRRLLDLLGEPVFAGDR